MAGRLRLSREQNLILWSYHRRPCTCPLIFDNPALDSGALDTKDKRIAVLVGRSVAVFSILSPC